MAVYKVCWEGACADYDILAAFNDPIDDGIDILSISLGCASEDYDIDPIAIGAFHAMKKGILTSVLAGNNGPYLQTVTNVAPWMLTVAANSLDRRTISNVTLKSQKTFVGLAINTFHTKKTFFPIIHENEGSERYCSGTHDKQDLMKGKIILCDDLGDGSGPFLYRAKGTVTATDLEYDYAFSFPLPATVISTADGEKIKSYLNSTR